MVSYTAHELIQSFICTKNILPYKKDNYLTSYYFLINSLFSLVIQKWILSSQIKLIKVKEQIQDWRDSLARVLKVLT